MTAWYAAKVKDLYITKLSVNKWKIEIYRSALSSLTELYIIKTANIVTASEIFLNQFLKFANRYFGLILSLNSKRGSIKKKKVY